MTQRPLVVVQRRPTQIDSPLFQRLAALGVDLTVRYAQLEQPIDPELGVRPDFGDRLLEGYRWSVGVGRFPPSAHVMVAGWASGFAWQSIVRRIGSGRTLGIRFDTVARRQQAGLLRWSAWLRQTVALRAADVWHPVGHASERYASKVVRNGRPVVPVPYAIDTAPFQGEASVKPNRNITVIAVSKLNEREGVRDLIVAASRMKGVRLRIVGDGPLRLELAELATQLRVDAKFIGYVPFAQLPAEYAVADVICASGVRRAMGSFGTGGNGERASDRCLECCRQCA